MEDTYFFYVGLDISRNKVFDSLQLVFPLRLILLGDHSQACWKWSEKNGASE